MNPRHLFLAAGAAALLAPIPLPAQISTPPTRDRIGTSSATELPRTPAQLSIASVSPVPAGFTAQSNAPLDLTLTVAVRNTGQTTGNFSLAATIPNSTGKPQTGTLQARPGSTTQTAFRMQATMSAVAFQGNQMPVTIRLLDDKGSELGTSRVMVPFSPPPAPSAPASTPRSCEEASSQLSVQSSPFTPPGGAPPRTTAGPNLDIVTLSVVRQIEIRDDIATRLSTGEQFRLSVLVGLRNTQAGGRWGYPASINFAINQGTPLSGLRPLTGASGGTVRVPGNIAAGESRDVGWNFDRAPFELGIWYTLDATLESTADTDRSDNAMRVIFMFDNQRRLVEQCAFRIVPSIRAGLVPR
jgi:hypothetical protein